MHVAMTTYNRADYLERTLSSLVKTDWPDGVVLRISDDNSSDSRVMELLLSFQSALDGVSVKIVQRATRLGCDDNMVTTIKESFADSPDQFVVTIDSDVDYNKGWLRKIIWGLKELDKEKVGSFGVFNTSGHSVEKNVGDGILKKNTLGGFCCALNRDLFLRSDLRVSQWDWSYVDLCKRLGYGQYCTERSYVEHFGESGKSNGYGNGPYDTAIDFVGVE